MASSFSSSSRLGSPLTLVLTFILILTTVISPALATNYTHFDDLPKCGQNCIGKDSIHDAVNGNRGNCPLDLACVCQSQYYNVAVEACLQGKGVDPCNKDAAMRRDVLAFMDHFWCNPDSDAKMTYQTKIGGHSVTFTLPAAEKTPAPETEASVTIAAHLSSSTSSVSVPAKGADVTSESESTSRSAVPTSKTSHDITSNDASNSNATATAAAVVTATATATAMVTATNHDQGSDHRSNSTDTSDSAQSTISEPATIASSVPSDDDPAVVTSVVHVTACTTVMGNTVTIRTTTNVVATANLAASRLGDYWYLDGICSRVSMGLFWASVLVGIMLLLTG